jgi:hypothetical protein
LNSKLGFKNKVSVSTEVNSLCLTHKWSCVDFEGKKCKDKNGKELILIADADTLEVPENFLANGVFYKFTVEITHDDKKSSKFFEVSTHSWFEG